VELPEGKHFWEVKLLSDNMGNTLIGNSKPNLDPKGWNLLAQRVYCVSVAMAMEPFGATASMAAIMQAASNRATVWACCGPWTLTAAPSIAFFKNRAQHGYAAAAAGNGNAKQCK
jgi:hypothetical protein